MIEPLISVERLSVGYEERSVFHHVSMTVPRNCSVALMGAAGVGKSTLLRTLGRFTELRPAFWARGTVKLDGRDLMRDFSMEEAQRLVVLFQQKARLFTATVLENAIAGGAEGRVLSQKDKLQLAHDVLSPWGLFERFEARMSAPVTTLSIAEQRQVLLARLVSGEARCVLLDEPLRDLDEVGRAEVAALLRAVRRTVSVVIVTHHLGEARELADSVVLLADGTLVEQTDVSQFFGAVGPKTELGARFRETGSCWTASPLVEPEESVVDGMSPAKEAAKPYPSWRPTAQESIPRPGGFHWILRDRLGGMQMPGLLREMDSDLRGARALGISYMVTLTEQPFPAHEAEKFGISVGHFPIDDMGVPTLERAHELTEDVLRRLEHGEKIVFHCRAGLGRTGTMLACVLVRSGEGAATSVERVRKVNPLYIQAEAQLAFIAAFADYCREGIHESNVTLAPDRKPKAKKARALG